MDTASREKLLTQRTESSVCTAKPTSNRNGAAIRFNGEPQTRKALKERSSVRFDF